MPLRVYLRRSIWACMLPLVAVAVYFGFRNVAEIRQAEDQAAAQLVLQAADVVEQSLRARLGAMAVLARSPLLDNGVPLLGFHQQAQGFRQSYGSDLILADAQGRMLLHGGQAYGSSLPALPRPAGRAAAPLAMSTGQPAVGDSFMAPLAKVRMTAVAVPVPGGAASERALLSVVPTQRFQDLLDRLPLPQGWTLSLFDSQHEMVARRPIDAARATESMRFVQALSLAPWTVEVEVSPAGRGKRALQAAAIIGMGILAATLVGLFAGTRASRRLSGLVSSLAGPQQAESMPGPAIAEIAAAHRAFDASARARQEAAAAMGQSDATFRAIFEGALDAVVLTDPERRIRLVNPAFTSLFGYSAEEAIGRGTDFLYIDQAEYEAAGRERLLPGAAAAACPCRSVFGAATAASCGPRRWACGCRRPTAACSVLSACCAT
jgi:PAS domain-containing protein